MVAAEGFADRRKRAVGHLAAEVHRDLPAKGDVLRALFRFQIGQPHMEKIRDGLLDSSISGVISCVRIKSRKACRAKSVVMADLLIEASADSRVREPSSEHSDTTHSQQA